MSADNPMNLLDSKNVVPLNTWVLISNFKLLYNLLRRPDGTFDRNLAEFMDRKVPANVIPVDGVLSFDVLIDRRTNLLCRVYRPSNSEFRPCFIEVEKPVTEDAALPVIIFFHGGSFVHSSTNSAIYDILCRRLSANSNAVVVSVDYRRSPEHRYPSAYDDGWAALQWVGSRAWPFGVNGSKVRVYLAGDSSGGNIVHHVSLRAVDSGVCISGNIMLNPMFGGTCRTESEKRLDGKYFVTVQDRDWYWRAFLPEGEDRDHPACNPFGPRGGGVGGVKLPQSLVVVSGLDLSREWQLMYAEELRKSGQQVELVYMEEATVGFYLLPNNPHFSTVMDSVKRLLHP